MKTQMAANRGQPMLTGLKAIYSRGGVLGFYQGLIPWAWIEASTKGAVLLFTASELEYRASVAGASPFLVSISSCIDVFSFHNGHLIDVIMVIGWYRWWNGRWYCSGL